MASVLIISSRGRPDLNFAKNFNRPGILNNIKRVILNKFLFLPGIFIASKLIRLSKFLHQPFKVLLETKVVSVCSFRHNIGDLVKNFKQAFNF